jgi:integrase/recombinase XerD
MESIEKSIGILNQYEKELFRCKKYSVKTIPSYCNDIKRLLDFTGKDATDITVDDLENFFLEDSPSTARRRYSSIVNFYKYLNKKDITQNYPITESLYENLRKDPERLSEKMTIPEGLAFLEEAKKKTKNYAIMMTFLNTGVREEELFTRMREDYHLETNTDGKQEGTIRIIGKGNKERIVPVNEGVINALNKYLETRTDNDPHLFLSNWGKQYSPSGIYTLVKRIAERAGIKKDITPHILRHTFSSMMWEQGADPVQIMYILGHSSIKTTLRYLGKLGVKKAQELMNMSAFNVR